MRSYIKIPLLMSVFRRPTILRANEPDNNFTRLFTNRHMSSDIVYHPIVDEIGYSLRP